MSEKETRNGKVVKDVELNRSPYVRIAEAEGFIKNWPDGYLMKIVHNPKKYLTGEKHINLYDMCERVEAAVEAYNLKNS